MSALILNQKVKVKPSHKFHPNREGHFQFMSGKSMDCIVLTQFPSPNGGWNSWFVVGAEDLEVPVKET